jgi:glycosyltransferase involved in cell wall biosynthesis
MSPKHAKFYHSLSVFFPAYNDAPSLPALIDAAFEALVANVDDFEVIVVNDGSADNTQEVAEALREKHGERMKVVRHEINRGYGGALRTGFETASKEYVFYTDGDGQYDVRELPKLLASALPEVGLVNGYKLQRHDPWHRIAIGSIYNQFARTLFGVRLRDIDCDFRLVKRSVLGTFTLTSTSGTVCVELVKGIERSGTMVVEVPVHHYPRLHGRSQFFRIRSLGTTFCQLIDLWVRLFVFNWLGWSRDVQPASTDLKR